MWVAEDRDVPKLAQHRVDRYQKVEPRRRVCDLAECAAFQSNRAIVGIAAPAVIVSCCCKQRGAANCQVDGGDGQALPWFRHLAPQ